MKKLILSIILIVSSLGFSVSFKEITKLNFREPYGSQLFHAGVLWEGRARADEGIVRQVEAYKADGTLIGTVTVDHSAQYIYKYSENSVMVTGNTDYPTHAKYTIVAYENGRLNVKARKTWPLDVMVYHYARLANGREFFGAPGGSLNQPPVEPGHSLEEGVESILYISGGSYKFVKVQLRFLQRILGHGNYLFAQEGGNFTGDANLARIDPSTQTVKKVFKRGEYVSLGNPINFDEKTVAIPSTDSHELLLVDVGEAKLKKSIKIAAETPRAIAKLGHCVVVASQESRKVTFIHTGLEKEIAVWDFAAVAGEKLYGLKNVDVDLVTQNIYVRSGFPAPLHRSSPDRNSVWMGHDDSGEVFRNCQN